MTQYYRLAQPGITSISVEGIEHRVNPATGLLEIEVRTPGLERELIARKATMADPGSAPVRLTDAETAERDALFAELDVRVGRRIDRRRSLQQLREMKSDLDDADKQRGKSAAAALAGAGAERAPAAKGSTDKE
jgi:hypothetical protein